VQYEIAGQTENRGEEETAKVIERKAYGKAREKRIERG
jgi:hypothetical protein